MNKLYLPLLLAGLFGLNTVAHADDVAKLQKDQANASYDARTDDAKAKYKADEDACKAMSGNDKDVCKKKAKADYKTAKAQAKAMKKTAKADANADETSREQAYKVAKEKCDAMSGDAKDACVSKAKLDYHQ